MEIYYYLPIIVGISGLVWYFINNNGNNKSQNDFNKKPPTNQTTTATTPGTTPRKNSSNNITRKKKPVQKKQKTEDGVHLIKIFFGSQTGTAEDFSHKLATEGKRYGFATEVVDCEDYDFDELHTETFGIFVMATYGEGEPTDNARAFDEWLNKEHKADELKGLKFTVFGLGNKTYEQFNAMGRKIDTKMAEFGAQRVFPKGEGDDDGSLEDDFAAWKRELWPALCEHFNIPIPEIEENLNERRFRVDILDPESKESHDAASSELHLAKKNATKEGSIFDSRNPYLAKMAVNRELHTTESDRSCRHIEFEIGKDLHYEVGDHLGVYPENDPKLVEQIATRLQVDLNIVFAMYPTNKSDKPVLGPCTVRQALTQWCDITGQPRKAVLKILARYAKDEEEKQKLLQLADENSNGYQSYIKDDQRTILCVLNDFPSIQIPFDHFLEITPRLAPRMYSISSSIKEHPGSVHITSVVVNFTTKVGRHHKGVCTNWLSRAIPTNEKPIYVPIFVEKANFRLPDNPSTPIVMVGPGTGLAPFRGFIQERKHVIRDATINSEAVLFFGCRSKKVDYIYQEELDHHRTAGHLTELVVAFSREGAQKVYVQHRIKEYSKLMYQLICEKNGYFYVCGDARAMAKDVRQTLRDLMIEHGNKTEEEAEQYISDMQKSGRYLQDVWF